MDRCLNLGWTASPLAYQCKSVKLVKLLFWFNVDIPFVHECEEHLKINWKNLKIQRILT